MSLCECVCLCKCVCLCECVCAYGCIHTCTDNLLSDMSSSFLRLPSSSRSSFSSVTLRKTCRVNTESVQQGGQAEDRQFCLVQVVTCSERLSEVFLKCSHSPFSKPTNTLFLLLIAFIQQLSRLSVLISHAIRND